MKLAVAIIGASQDRTKFGNKSVRAHLRMGYEVFPVHPKAEIIEGLRAYPSLDQVPRQDLERVSFYVPPAVGLQVIDQAARKKVNEVWLNPGAESEDLVAAGQKLGLNMIVGCSIVALGIHPADLDD